MSWYVYCSNNPLTRIDQTGFEDDEANRAYIEKLQQSSTFTLDPDQFIDWENYGPPEKPDVVDDDKGLVRVRQTDDEFNKRMIDAFEGPGSLGQLYVPRIEGGEADVPISKDRPRNDCDIWAYARLKIARAFLPPEMGSSDDSVKTHIKLMKAAGLLEGAPASEWSVAMLEDSEGKAVEHLLVVRKTEAGFRIYEMGGLKWVSAKKDYASLGAMMNDEFRKQFQDTWYFYPLRSE